MGKYTAFLLILTFFSSCTLMMNKRERRLQTDIISKINAQAPNLAKCAKSARLFKALDKTRIRVVIDIAIDSNGQIERFKLDEKKYPERYAECIFKVLDIISFPKVEKGEVIELKQPFIFLKK